MKDKCSRDIRHQIYDEIEAIRSEIDTRHGLRKSMDLHSDPAMVPLLESWSYMLRTMASLIYTASWTDAYGPVIARIRGLSLMLDACLNSMEKPDRETESELSEVSTSDDRTPDFSLPEKPKRKLNKTLKKKPARKARRV